MAPVRCITNNPMLLNRGFSELEYHDIDVLGLFQIVMREVASGYQLLSHPLTGSIRPDITPYKTVLLSDKPGQIDPISVQLIGKAISYAENLYQLRDVPIYQLWSAKERKDFQLVDLSIIEQALEVAQLSR